jgi:hypothetical protein
VKTWHVLVLAGSILIGCLGGSAILAAAKSYSPAERYHYSNVSLGTRLTRIDKVTGAVQVYDADRGWGWVDFESIKNR